MLNGQRVVVVMPAYNAARTLRQAYEEIAHDVVDEVILVDDASGDDTVTVATDLGLQCYVHRRNAGYGANQKTCYRLALGRGADVVVMIHPDYQYTPKLITGMAGMVTSGVYDAVIGSRILGRGARAGGMPRYKYVANRALTATQNIFFNRKLSEYHTGFRAFSSEVLTRLPLEENSDDFVFDNEMLAQLIFFGFEIGEISCPAKYFEDASSIGFRKSVKYGLGVLRTTWRYRAATVGMRQPIFDAAGKTLESIPHSTVESGPDASLSIVRK